MSLKKPWFCALLTGLALADVGTWLTARTGAQGAASYDSHYSDRRNSRYSPRDQFNTSNAGSLAAAGATARTTPPRLVEWRYYGGDQGSTKYSPLDQIHRGNVKDLKIAWRWKADNFGARPDFNYQATPIMVGGVLYTTAGSRRDVVAIDGVTGETLWMYRFDEGTRAQMAPARASSGRGVAYWTDGKGDERILYVTLGYQLIALNAKTGQPIASFGHDGQVDLYDGLDQLRPKDGQITWGSPPMIVRNVAVIGANLGGGNTKEFVAGHVRGYDVRTGKRLWIFHTIPRPGEFGNETWKNDSWSYTGHTGAWAPMSGDEELGYVYVATETPTNDFYGGHRPGDNLFAESVLCLDARTGKRVWHYQLIHHGIWDWDIPTAPTLGDVTINGRRVKIAAQITKQGWVYVFDRVTGQPVWPIVERPVPQSDVPGEFTSPTQPIPTRPPPFERQGISVDDLIDFTPELKAEAVRIASQYKIGPIFTPPIVRDSNGLRGFLMLPASTGGANWQGGAFDPETGIVYIASATNPTSYPLVKGGDTSNMNYVMSLRGRAGADTGSNLQELRDGQRAALASDQPNREGCPGFPYGPLGPRGLPLIKPPWGRITAIDLTTGEQRWMVPNGDTPDCVKNHPALKGITIPKTGKPERAGLLVTKTLLFGGEGSGLFAMPPYAGGPMFYAYDKRSGDVIWEFRLPANQSSIPMTYLIDQRQYIVVAVGARGQPAELVALSLP
jgi:quinoprotein glucose dehydrogenase